MNITIRDKASIDFASLPRDRLLAMQKAADDMIGVLQEAAQQDKHILIDVLGSTSPDPFTMWQHYPRGDVRDKKKGAVWFYHAHAEDKEARPWIEHGHFHLFVYTEHVAEGVEPIALPPEPDFENGGLCHLVAISFDHSGTPIRVFTTNRWVAAEWQYPAEEVIRLLDYFDLDNDEFALTTRWLKAALQLFRPQIEWSLIERDKAIEVMRRQDPEGFSEDTSVEALSSFEFDLGSQIDGIENALAADE